jgi:tRNA A-37 threonylcarbamoyl transferase component Bud32
VLPPYTLIACAAEHSAKLEVAERIGSGIARMHDADVIHGDLTTSNVLVTPAMQVVRFFSALSIG